MSLAVARLKAREHIGEVASGKHKDTNQSVSVTFVRAREKFLEDSWARNKASTYGEYKRLLEKYFTYPEMLDAITRQDVMDVVASLKDRPGEAQHAFVAIRTMMNWAVHRGLIQSSPVPPMRFGKVSRTRILSDEELKLVWKRAAEVGYPYGTIVQLLILTGQRRGEIAGLHRSWTSHDAITFPAGFCKNKREHWFPIGPFTKEIIASIRKNTDMLFPARGVEDRPFSGWSKAKREFVRPLSIVPYTLHDLRRTYSSQLAALGTPIHVTEKLLNHVSGTLSDVAAVYNRYSYADEMRQAVTAYEAHIAKLIKA
jgi:integrase